MKNHSILISLAVVLFAASFTAARYSGGTGTADDPYRIATPQDLNDIGNHREDWDKYFILINDVNLAAYTGTQFKIIGNCSKRLPVSLTAMTIKSAILPGLVTV